MIVHTNGRWRSNIYEWMSLWFWRRLYLRCVVNVLCARICLWSEARVYFCFLALELPICFEFFFFFCLNVWSLSWSGFVLQFSGPSSIDGWSGKQMFLLWFILFWLTCKCVCMSKRIIEMVEQPYECALSSRLLQCAQMENLL